MKEPIAGYRFSCVVAYGPSTCVEYDTAEELAARLREVYDDAIGHGRPDVKVYVVAGQRLTVGGANGRVLRLPDGTEIPIADPKVADDDYLLSSVDRATMGGPVDG